MRRRAPSGVLALPVDVAAADDLQARHDRERDREGEDDVLEAEAVGGERQQHESRPSSTARTPCTCRAVARAARSPRRPAIDRYSEMPNSRTAMSSDRPPREHAAVGEHGQAADHDQLVGDRVEERARPRRAVAACEPAVETVGRGDREPERDRRPRRAVARESARASGWQRGCAPTVTKLAGVATAPCPKRFACRGARRGRHADGVSLPGRDLHALTVAATIAPGRANTSPPIAREAHDAVDLGRFAVGAPDEPAVFVDPVDEHLDRLTHQGAARGVGDRVLHLRAFTQALVHERSSTPPSIVAAGVPSSRENAKNPAQSSRGVGEEREQLRRDRFRSRRGIRR